MGHKLHSLSPLSILAQSWPSLYLKTVFRALDPLCPRSSSSAAFLLLLCPPPSHQLPPFQGETSFPPCARTAAAPSPAPRHRSGLVCRSPCSVDEHMACSLGELPSICTFHWKSLRTAQPGLARWPAMSPTPLALASAPLHILGDTSGLSCGVAVVPGSCLGCTEATP